MIKDEIKDDLQGLTPFSLGSSLDEEISNDLDGFYLGINSPVSEQLVMDKSYAGCNVGLRLAKDVFLAIFKRQ